MRRPWLVPAGLLTLRAALGAWAARAYSATFDEPELIAAGWSYWTQGDMRLDPMHPALGLLWNALPLLPLGLPLPDGPEWRQAVGAAFGERLLFWSGHDGDRLVELARLPNLLLGAAVGAALWARARRLWGEGPAALALAFYCFCPVVLAHSSLATTDFSPAALGFFAALALSDFLRRPAPRPALLTGLAGAAAFLAKYSAAALAPALVLLLVLAPASGGVSKARRARLFLLHGVLPGLAVLAAALAVLPVMREGLWHHLRFVTEGVEVFAFGTVYPSGWRWFPAAALAVKSTLPELLVLAAAVVQAARRRLKAEPEVLCFLAVLLSFSVMVAFSRKQLGARYFLSAYVLLPFAAAALAAGLLRRPKGALLAGALGAWQAACALGAAPDFLPYFNEACGGAAGGHRCLSDSNLDWGQDLERLGAFAREKGSPELILAYFGTASPETYGMRPQHLSSHGRIRRLWMNSDAPAAEWLAASRVALQGIYDEPPGPPSWVPAREPDARIGWSLLAWDVTNDAAAHAALAAHYERTGDKLLAARERRRAR